MSPFRTDDNVGLGDTHTLNVLLLFLIVYGRLWSIGCGRGRTLLDRVIEDSRNALGGRFLPGATHAYELPFEWDSLVQLLC